jgi:nucleoside phosphorylase
MMSAAAAAAAAAACDGFTVDLLLIRSLRAHVDGLAHSNMPA